MLYKYISFDSSGQPYETRISSILTMKELSRREVGISLRTHNQLSGEEPKVERQCHIVFKNMDSM